MIEFYDGHGNWIMKLENGRVYFNRERWPECSPDAFALAVIELLEKASVKLDNWKKVDPIKNEEASD
jgi:hypothetical protein